MHIYPIISFCAHTHDADNDNELILIENASSLFSTDVPVRTDNSPEEMVFTGRLEYRCWD